MIKYGKIKVKLKSLVGCRAYLVRDAHLMDLICQASRCQGCRFFKHFDGGWVGLTPIAQTRCLKKRKLKTL